MKITTQLNPSLPVLSKNPTASNFLPKGLPTDIQGADLEALTRFNQSLPKVVPKVLKKPGEEEALDELSEVVSDSPEWQMAQAEAVGAGAGAEAAAAAAAEAAGAGAAGSGAAGAGAAGAGAAGAAGAGAAGAVGVLSPLAFTPSLLLVNGGSNSAPIATFTTAQNADEDGSVISGQLTSTDPDGIDLGTTYSLVGDPIPGLTINENGAWSFDATGNAYQSLAQGETREITVSYVVTDTPGATDTASFVITVTGTNDVPVVQVTDVVGGVTELVTPAGNLSDSGTISFTDVDLIDLHTVSEVTPSEDALGTLTATVSTGTDDSTGLGGVITWNYSVAASAVEYIAEGETKVETFTFSLLDGQGGSVERTVTITITGTNDAPILTVDAEGGVTEDDADSTTLSDSGTLSFTDVDVTDTHAVTASYNEDAVWTNTSDATLSDEQITALTNGFVIKGDKSGWDYSVANSATQFLAKGETVTFSYDVTVQDDSGVIANNSDTKKVTVTITGTNDQPTLTLEEDTVYLAVNAMAGEIGCAVAEADDVDATDELSYHFLVDGERSETSENGFFSINTSTGNISLTELGESMAGLGQYDLASASYQVDVVAYDGLVNSDSKTLTIERVLPDGQAGTPDTDYGLATMLQESSPYNDDSVKVMKPYEGKVHIVINDSNNVNPGDENTPGKSFDILDLDDLGELNELEVERHHDDLVIEFDRPGMDSIEVTIKNHFLTTPAEGQGLAAIEYVHFDPNSSFAGYQLSNSESEVLDACDENFFPENGSYRIGSTTATEANGLLNGTNDNDLIVGSKFTKTIEGGEGNDLLFAGAEGVNLVGGEGDDLLVLDAEYSSVEFSAAEDNGYDTVVHFDEDHKIVLDRSDVHPELDAEEAFFISNALLTEGEDTLLLEGDDIQNAAVIAMDAATFNLHTWLNNPESTIDGIAGVAEGAKLFFLVEESGSTHLYHATDSGDGVLQASEFTHMAHFYSTSIGEFSADNVSFTVMPV